MKTLRLEVELTYDDVLAHSGDEDAPAKQWFFRDILQGNDRLTLHSDEIGDTVGEIVVTAMKP